MEIVLNGEPRRFAAATTLASLLEAEGLAGRRVAVEVNGMIVPRGQHASQRLADGDRVEIVHALGGGWAGHRRYPPAPPSPPGRRPCAAPASRAAHGLPDRP